MQESTPRDLSDAFLHFMPQFFLFIDPILHSGRFNGKKYNEKKIIVLMALSVCGPQTPSQISAAFSLQKGSLTTIIKGLIETGLVRKEPVSGDDRSYRLNLTDQGRTVVTLLGEQREREFDRLFAEMPSPNLALARAGLVALTTYLERKGS